MHPAAGAGLRGTNDAVVGEEAPGADDDKKAPDDIHLYLGKGTDYDDVKGGGALQVRRVLSHPRAILSKKRTRTESFIASNSSVQLEFGNVVPLGVGAEVKTNSASLDDIYHMDYVTREESIDTYDLMPDIDPLHVGTHVIVSVLYGGRFAMRVRKRETGVDVRGDVHASFTATNFKVDTTFKQSESIEVSESNQIGPRYEDDEDKWRAAVEKSPQPICFNLRPLTNYYRSAAFVRQFRLSWSNGLPDRIINDYFDHMMREYRQTYSFVRGIKNLVDVLPTTIHSVLTLMNSTADVAESEDEARDRGRVELYDLVSKLLAYEAWRCFRFYWPRPVGTVRSLREHYKIFFRRSLLPESQLKEFLADRLRPGAAACLKKFPSSAHFNALRAYLEALQLRDNTR